MDLKLISKARCGSKEKNEMIKIIAEIIALSNISRRKGFLELLEVVDALSCDFLKIGIRLMLKGIDPALIEETMLKLIYTQNYNGEELLKRLIIIEGIQSIQLNENKSLIEYRLISMLGEKLFCEFMEDSSELDLKLQDNNPFKSSESKVSEYIKLCSESSVSSKLIEYHLKDILDSYSLFELFAGIYLFKDKQEVLSSLILQSELDRMLFLDKLVPVVSELKGKTLSIEELRELAVVIQSCFENNDKLIAEAVDTALCEHENVVTEYRNKKIIEYKDDFNNRAMEFFKVILSLMTEKRNFHLLTDSYLCEIVIYTIVNGKTAVDFIKEKKII